MADAKRENARLQAEAEKVTDGLAAVKETEAQYKNRCEVLSTEVDQLQKAKAKLQLEMDERERKSAQVEEDFKAECSALRDEKKALALDSDTKATKIKTLEDQISDMKMAEQRLATKLESGDKAKNLELTRVQDEVTAKDDRIRVLEKDLQEMRNTLSQERHKASEIEKQLQEAHESEKAVADAKRENARLQAEAERVTDGLAAVKETEAQYKNRCEALNTEVDQLQKTKAKLQLEMDERESKSAQVEEDLKAECSALRLSLIHI